MFPLRGGLCTQREPTTPGAKRGDHHWIKVLTELAASCTLAAARRLAGRFAPDDHVVLLLCGGNVSVEDLLDYHARFARARRAA